MQDLIEAKLKDRRVGDGGNNGAYMEQLEEENARLRGGGDDDGGDSSSFGGRSVSPSPASSSSFGLSKEPHADSCSCSVCSRRYGWLSREDAHDEAARIVNTRCLDCMRDSCPDCCFDMATAEHCFS